MTYFSGRVSSVVYGSGEFHVLKVMLDGGLVPVSVRGNFAAQKIANGVWVGFDGEWEEHPSYGKQLAVKRSPVPPPKWTPEIAASILSANGVGTTTVTVLRTALGDDFVAALDKGTEALADVPLDNFAKDHAVSRWRSAVAHLRTLSYLYDSGVPAKIIGKVWSAFGDDAPKVLSTNPWALLKIDGVTFAHADEIAYKLGVPMSSPERAKGAAQYALKSSRNEGHLYLTPDEIRDGVTALAPGVVLGPVDDLVAEMTKEGLCRVDQINGVTAVYDPWAYTLEAETAHELLRRSTGSKADRDKAGEELDAWAETSNVQLTGDQRAAAVNALTEPVSILTGLPGTGKTTTLKAVVRVLLDLGVPFLLCAPTGIAAKRMASVTNAPAATIHRAFGAKNFKADDGEREVTYSGVVGDSTGPSDSTGIGERWEYTPKNPHPAKVVIVDESSMVDQHLLYRIVQGTSQDCRLVFVGDAAQLPSVGPGDVLRQMVASKAFPVVALTEIFRQAELSGIVVAAHDIHKGQTPVSDGKDFVLVTALSEDAAAATVTQVAEKLYAARKNFQVLSPRHGGPAGVTELNRRLRATLNPGQPGLVEHRIGSDTIREDDRVMITKNDYELDVYNGDVGKVARIDRKSKDIEILIHGTTPARQVRIPTADAASKVRLAYAQTVHKSQGQEYDIIVAPILSSFGVQLQRNLYYTAVTRAKRKVVLVGTADALARAVANDRADKRNTLFAFRLQQVEGGQIPDAVG